MSCEIYTKIYEDYTQGTPLRPQGEEKHFRFTLSGDPNKKYRLFATGETGLFYQWKNEPDFPLQYRTICDALDGTAAEQSAYALKLSSKKAENYLRRAYKKVTWPPKLSYLSMNPVPTQWEIGLYVKTKNLIFENNGYLRMRADIRYKHKATNTDLNVDEADESHILDIPTGTTNGYVKISKNLYLPTDDVLSVSVFIEGIRYSGDVYVEKPFLVYPDVPDKGVLPDFSMPVSDKTYYDWTGLNLSRKEWPEFRLTLNGTVFFEGELFERCHRHSEWSVDLPRELLRGENELSVALVSDYHDALPYTLHELATVATPAGKFSLLAVSETAAAHGRAHALIRTEEENVTLSIRCANGLSANERITFTEKGLHGISFSCGALMQNAYFELSCDDKTERGTIKRIVQKEPDGIYTGTGDLVYIQETTQDFEEYLVWYLSSKIGNLLTIRPTYRWGGSRVLNRAAFDVLLRVLNEWEMPYSHMLDGRELPGICANPDENMLAGKHFLGRQLHERDGACFYWRNYVLSNSETQRQVRDLFLELCREDPSLFNPQEGGAEKYIFNKKETSGDTNPRFQFRNPTLKKDMKIAHDEAVQRLSIERCGNPRHTGPSVMFKYLFEAGYQWLGAETMYSSIEPQLAFLRGADSDFGIDSRGVHHALQWSTSPHDTPEHVRRYRLALYVSYMQGATEINTEEGLWHLEEYYAHFHRFSETCREHTKQQTDFYRYISTHTRRGNFYTPIGIVHGRYDGWHGFGKNAVWGWQNVTDTDAEKSWDLLSVFYPESDVGNPLYFHGISNDKPLGFYSSTPLGNIDVIPAEQRRNTYQNYKALAFLGYHYMETTDAEKLLDYVKKGGRLLMTRAHMSITTDYEAVLAGKLEYADTALSMTNGKMRFADKYVNGVPIPICVNALPCEEILASCDDGTPLVCRYKIGNGEITLCNASVYPAHPIVKPLYEQELERHARYAAADENVRATVGKGVEFSIYKNGDETDVYFLAVDWYRDPTSMRQATLYVNDIPHALSFPFGVLLKAAVWKDFAAYPHNEDGEAISVKNGIAKLQGIGRVAFTLIHGENERTIEIDFSKQAIVEIPV